jgi:hypothetical protein
MPNPKNDKYHLENPDEIEILDDSAKNSAMQLVPKVIKSMVPEADSTCTDIASVVYCGSTIYDHVFSGTGPYNVVYAWTGMAEVEMQLPIVIRRSGDSVEVKTDSAGIGLRK